MYSYKYIILYTTEHILSIYMNTLTSFHAVIKTVLHSTYYTIEILHL